MTSLEDGVISIRRAGAITEQLDRSEMLDRALTTARALRTAAQGLDAS